MKKLSLLLGVSACALIACADAADTDNGQTSTNTSSHVSDTEISRPVYPFTTEERYEPSAVPAYAGDHSAIYQHIDDNIETHVGELQRWLKQPSISAQNVGITEMATMLKEDLDALGFQETALVPTDGHPGVWGYYDAGAEETLLVYMMYDVQPVNPEDWQSPPFEANIVDHQLGKVIMARGAVNQKGPERAFLNALASIIAVKGKLPVNLMIAAEGEEELGSPHYPQIVDAYEDRMKQASGVLFPMTAQRPDGSPNMLLGVKGILYFEIEARGGRWGGPARAEIHGSFKGTVSSPTLRLIQAIGSMTSKDGDTILVPGYYDDIRPPTLEEQKLMNKVADNGNDKMQQLSLGVSRWIDDLTGREALMNFLYTPTLNVDGIWSGYTGTGVKTILPHLATAKMDSRLPAGQDPDIMLQRIRDHLDANGFEDIVLRKLSGYPAAQTSVNSGLSQSVIGVYNKYTDGLSIQPRIAGSAPFYQFTERLKLPLVPAGLGFGTGAHAPNEILLIEPKDGVSIASLADIEKSYVDLMYALAEGQAEDSD